MDQSLFIWALHRYRRPLSCRFQFGRASDVRRPNASPLGSHFHPLHPLFSVPPLVRAPLFLHLVFRIMSPMARTPVTQHDLFSYQLLTPSTFSESLLTHARARVGKGLWVCTCSRDTNGCDHLCCTAALSVFYSSGWTRAAEVRARVTSTTCTLRVRCLSSR